MSPNAPLTPEGRRRLCERIDAGTPLSHVADAGGISRQALGKWYGRWLNDGMEGLYDSEVLTDEKGATAAGFWLRAALWFQLNGINRIEKVLTDNGSCYRSQDFIAAVATVFATYRLPNAE